MTESAQLTPDDLHSIETRARILRAQALANGLAALGRWIVAHLPFGHRSPALR